MSGAFRLPGTTPDPPAAGGGARKPGRFVDQHKKELAVAGAAAVALLAWRRKRTASPSALASGVAGVPATPAGSFTGSGGGNDSTASDFASYVQGQVEPLQQSLAQLTANQSDLAAQQTGIGAQLGGLGSSISALQGRLADGFGTPASPVQTPVADAPPAPTLSGAPGQAVPAAAPVVPIAAPVPAPTPSFAGSPISADYYTASQPGAVLGMPSNTKPLLSYTEAQRQTLLTGGSVGGAKLQPGTNYTVPVPG